MATMRGCPIPETLWRSPVGSDGKVDTSDAHRVVVGIRSALAGAAQDPDVLSGAHDELMFGGSRDPASLHGLHALHACPGYHMALGVLLGMITAVLEAGTFAPTPTPLLVDFTGPRPAPKRPRPGPRRVVGV